MRFSSFEDNWQQRILSDISTKITDGTHDTPRPTETGVPYITAIHVKDGFIDFDNCYFLPEKEHKDIYRRCNPEKGDLLMVNIGAGTGSAALVSVEYEFGMKNVALIKPNKGLIDPMFFSQVQRNKSARLKHQLTSGGAQPFLSLKQIGKLKIAIPTLEEQKKIAAFLGAVDERIAQLQKKKDLLEDYKKGCMQKLFSQELRFTDDNGNPFPDWEERPLGSLVSLSAGTSKSKHITEEGERFIIDMGSVSTSGKLIPTKKTNYKDDLLKAGQLIMPKDDIGGGRIIGRVGLIDQDDKYVLGDHVYLLSNIKCNSLFLSYIINSFEINKSFRRKANGTAQLGLARNSVLKQLVKIPTHIDEQKKIADFLSAIDDKIALVAEELDKAKSFKKGLLQQMFV